MSQDATPDIARWLGEIQSLQRQIVALRQERDLAYASADNLRNLYETEARQRQRDITASQHTIDHLKKALEALRSPQAENAEQNSAELASIQNTGSVAQLQAQLIAAKQQCEQLKALLQAEQTHHAQTRESLTAALGDAVDLLAKERVETNSRLAQNEPLPNDRITDGR